MTAKELAEKLDGIEYPTCISNETIKEAKEHNLVIVYGSSDDLMEFEGAITDEVDAYDGNTVRVCRDGLLENFEAALISEDINRLRVFFKYENRGEEIHALWCEEDNISWTYKTDIPHHPFKIVEDDDEVYCRGIVFSLNDIHVD